MIKKEHKSTILFMLILLLPAFSSIAQDSLELGRAAFLDNKPQEAISYLSNAVETGSASKDDYLYLGIAHQQMGDYGLAADVFETAITKTSPPHGRFYFNLGNNLFANGDIYDAETAFSKAISQDDSLTDAYLNRANVRMKLNKLSDAVGDYRYYLLRVPDAPQKETIEELIRRIEVFQMNEEERKRLEEEERQLEQERQRALLESVLNSLQNAEDDTVNLKADSEDVEDFDMELDIED